MQCCFSLSTFGKRTLPGHMLHPEAAVTCYSVLFPCGPCPCVPSPLSTKSSCTLLLIALLYTTNPHCLLWVLLATTFLSEKTQYGSVCMFPFFFPEQQALFSRPRAPIPTTWAPSLCHLYNVLASLATPLPRGANVLQTRSAF